MKNKRNKYLVIAFIVLNIFIWLFWELSTWAENYIWADVGIASTEAIKEACKNIFWIKYPYWLLSINLALISIYLYFNKKILIPSILLSINFIAYFTFSPIIKENLAEKYYIIFENQFVSEPYIQEPLLEAGFDVGKFVLPNIKSKDYHYRRYAIGAIGKLKHYPSIKILEEILFDESEEFYIRGDAFEALEDIDTNETKKVLYKFQKYLENSADKKLKEHIQILKRV